LLSKLSFLMCFYPLCGCFLIIMGQTSTPSLDTKFICEISAEESEVYLHYHLTAMELQQIVTRASDRVQEDKFLRAWIIKQLGRLTKKSEADGFKGNDAFWSFVSQDTSGRISHLKSIGNMDFSYTPDELKSQYRVFPILRAKNRAVMYLGTITENSVYLSGWDRRKRYWDCDLIGKEALAFVDNVRKDGIYTLKLFSLPVDVSPEEIQHMIKLMFHIAGLARVSRQPIPSILHELFNAIKEIKSEINQGFLIETVIL